VRPAGGGLCRDEVAVAQRKRRNVVLGDVETERLACRLGERHQRPKGLACAVVVAHHDVRGHEPRRRLGLERHVVDLTRELRRLEEHALDVLVRADATRPICGRKGDGETLPVAQPPRHRDRLVAGLRRAPELATLVQRPRKTAEHARAERRVVTAECGCGLVE
jgi:hypothetical protein